MSDGRKNFSVFDGQAIHSDGRDLFTADQSMGAHKLTEVADPTNNQDAASKASVAAATAALLSTHTPQSLGTAAPGNGTLASKDNHVHAHGDLAGASLHAVADTSTAGFLSAADKIKINAQSGTNTGDQTITLTGDVTGSGTGTFAATIANGAVTNAKMANMATATLKGRKTAGTGDPEDLSKADVLALLNVADGAQVCSAANVLTGLAAAAGDVAINTHKVTGVVDPAAAQDAATKNYVDTKSAPLLISFGNSSFTGLAANNTYYLSSWYGSGTAAGASEQTIVVPAGKCQKLLLNIGVNTRSAGTATFTVRKNASNQTMVVVVNSTGLAWSDVAHAFSVADGDILSISIALSSAWVGSLTGYQVSLLLTLG